MEIERGSTRSHFVKNSLWKKLWTCHKIEYRLNSCHNITFQNRKLFIV